MSVEAPMQHFLVGSKLETTDNISLVYRNDSGIARPPRNGMQLLDAAYHAVSAASFPLFRSALTLPVPRQDWLLIKVLITPVTQKGGRISNPI
ncbi:hypothetical protein N7481_005146 [Penicillium waksmanii]|uniref:uncharacterized protein n=1 Tax=Penicillium waksmanii TaxID=69791 RepID=UPI002546BAE4|nr:uncharacterized protein N7481_005146 [Penicillium waksmanii]KAJ5983047.1 hypothetical protein N7481_005146 [Penicillium waksmanii]